MDTPIGRLDVAALDCPDPEALAAFYQSVIGGRTLRHEGGHWVEVHTADGRVAFQQVTSYRAPTWPEGPVPQQAHLDIYVEDLDAGEEAVLERGAVKADVQPDPADFRVFFDPAGHPFCLVGSTMHGSSADAT
jgi:catechol 2,3-dioxygenase-like lactoylglutathione lyase family enzyme